MLDVRREKGELPAFLRSFEFWFFSVTVAFIGVSRLYLVSAKPLHHDESLFGYYSYFLYIGRGYEYQPILHGPILEHFTALIFLLFGDNQFTLRLPAIIGGLLLFPVAWYWRRYIGWVGFMAAMLLIALSPSITYYSRFLRNDVPYMTATCWCALCVLRALQTGDRRYFWGGILAAALMFSMMESSIFFFFTCVSFLVVVTVTDWLTGLRGDKDGWKQFPDGVVIFIPRTRGDTSRRLTAMDWFWCLMAAAILDVLLAWIFWRVFYSWFHLYKPVVALLGVSPRVGNVVIALGALPGLFLLCLLALTNFRAPSGRLGVLHYFLRVCWQNKWAIIGAAAIGLAAYELFFTTFFTNTKNKDFQGHDVAMTPLQIYKNTWDYWWDQHKLHRIKGPFHYYLPLLFNYELPAILICFWGAWCSLKQGPRSWIHILLIALAQLFYFAAYGIISFAASKHGNAEAAFWEAMDKKLHISSPVHVAMIIFYVQVLTHITGVLFARGNRVESFLLFWTVSALFAYSYAGEKVPWLAVHVAGPMCLLAGYYVQRLATEIEWTRARRLFATLAICLAVLWQFRINTGLNFVRPAVPSERLVYNHTSPDIEFAVKRIREIAHETNYGNSMPLFIKGEMEWPLYWYLRDMPNAFPPPSETAETTSRSIVLVNWESAYVDNLKNNYDVMRLKVREWWEPPLLDFAAMAEIWRGLSPLESRRGSYNEGRYALAVMEWKKLWHYLAYREIWLDAESRDFSNGDNEFAFCVRKDLKEQLMNSAWLSVMPKRQDIPVYPY